MADSFNTQVAEALVRHDIDLTRLDAGNARRIRTLFRTLSADVVEKLLKIDPTGTTSAAIRNKRLRQLLEAVDGIVDEAYEELEAVVAADTQDVARMEAAEVAATANEVVGVELMSGRLNANVLKRLADKTLIQGAPSKDWWRDNKTISKKAFLREMREGVLLGESVQDLVRRIRGRREHGFKDGLMSYTSKASRQAQALARSSIMSVANAARFETYTQNSDVVKGVKWMSTLDTRTTEICIALDGQAWTLDGKRLPGTVHKWRGPPPAHWNCRSTLSPVLRSWSDLITNRSAKKKVLAAEKSGKLAKGWRASMDGRVPDDLNYGDWLRKKERAEPGFAKEVLGARKYKLWKDGKLKPRDLIDQSHQPFTLKDLTDKMARERKR